MLKKEEEEEEKEYHLFESPRIKHTSMVNSLCMKV